MATHESRRIKGWRSRMEEKVEVLRKRVWGAPATTVYEDGGMTPHSPDDLVGHAKWFHREFGPERAIASLELKRHQAARAKIARSEEAQEQRAARLARNRAWKARQPPEWREEQNAALRAKRAAQSDAWHRAEAVKKRQRRAAKPELYREIDRRYAERHRLERNARKRAAYARDPVTARAKNNAWKSARREGGRASPSA